MLGQLVVAEVGHAGARRHNQAVVGEGDGDAVRASGRNLPALEIEAGDLGQQHGGVLLKAQDVPERGGDLPLGEDAGRDLVQERLEQMMGLAVDEGDVDRRPAERARREEPAEAAARRSPPGGGSPVFRLRPPRPAAADCAGRARTAAAAPGPR